MATFRKGVRAIQLVGRASEWFYIIHSYTRHYLYTYIVVVMLQVGERYYTEVQNTSENIARFPPHTARDGLGFVNASVYCAQRNDERIWF